MRLTYLANISKIKNINRNSKNGVDHGHNLSVFGPRDGIAVPRYNITLIGRAADGIFQG